MYETAVGLSSLDDATPSNSGGGSNAHMKHNETMLQISDALNKFGGTVTCTRPMLCAIRLRDLFADV